MIGLKINKREKILSLVLVIILFGITINKFVMVPIKRNLISLNDNKEGTRVSGSVKKNVTNEEDIILKIEKEIKKLLTISSINKINSWDEENNEENNIEIKVSGSLENLFKLEDKIEILGLKDKLKDITIIKNNEGSNVDCIMLFKVG